MRSCLAMHRLNPSWIRHCSVFSSQRRRISLAEIESTPTISEVAESPLAIPSANHFALPPKDLNACIFTEAEVGVAWPEIGRGHYNNLKMQALDYLRMYQSAYRLKCYYVCINDVTLPTGEEKKKGQEVSLTGSCFAVEGAPKALVTAAHCVATYQALEGGRTVVVNSREVADFEYTGRSSWGKRSEFSSANVAWRDMKRDIAVLQVSDPELNFFPKLKLRAIEEGEEILRTCVCGYRSQVGERIDARGVVIGNDTIDRVFGPVNEASITSLEREFVEYAKQVGISEFEYLQRGLCEVQEEDGFRRMKFLNPLLAGHSGSAFVVDSGSAVGVVIKDAKDSSGNFASLFSPGDEIFDVVEKMQLFS